VFYVCFRFLFLAAVNISGVAAVSISFFLFCCQMEKEEEVVLVVVSF
jgi:hypothetical protein